MPQFRWTPLWEASLWARVFRRSVAERARLPQGTAMQGEGATHERIPCGACVIIRSGLALSFFRVARSEVMRVSNEKGPPKRA